LFSVDLPSRSYGKAGRAENNKKQALRAIGDNKYCEAIDFFLLPSTQRQKKSIFSLRSLRLCGERKVGHMHIFQLNLF
jgi:hypothetical protein